MTYEQIKDALIKYLEDESTEFKNIFPTLLQNAEERVSKDLSTSLAHYSEGVTTTLNAGISTYTLLTRYEMVRWVEVSSNDTVYFPELRDVSYVKTVYPNFNTTNVKPFRYYAYKDVDTIYLVPPANTSYSVKVGYFVSLVGLAPGTSTWLSTNYSDLLLYAVLAEGEIFHKSPDLKQMYEAQYTVALATAKQKEFARKQTYLSMEGTM